MSTLRVETADHVTTLTLSRPEKRNALNAELRRALVDLSLIHI